MHITIKTNSKIISRKRKGNKKKLLAQKAMKIYLSVKEIIIYPNHHPHIPFTNLLLVLLPINFQSIFVHL